MHERVQRAIESLVPGEVVEMPPRSRVPGPTFGSHWRRPVKIQAMPDGTICRKGHRIAVRNCHTGRLSYIDAVTLSLVKAARSMAPEHACIKSDGGTPGRKCRRCEQDDPQPMPTIQVGDVVARAMWEGTSDYHVVISDENIDYHRSYPHQVDAIYRDPLWRRPQAGTTKGDES